MIRKFLVEFLAECEILSLPFFDEQVVQNRNALHDDLQVLEFRERERRV